ncbi:TatD family hydrolase [Geobacillus thermoleovorans]
MIDAHIHLEQYTDIDEQINHWQEAGITGVVAVSTDLRSSCRTLELK